MIRETELNYHDLNHGNDDVNMICFTIDAGAVSNSDRTLYRRVSSSESGGAPCVMHLRIVITYKMSWLVRKPDLNYINPSVKRTGQCDLG